MGFPFLSFIVFLPLLAAIGLAAIKADRIHAIKVASLSVSILIFVVSLPIYFGFELSAAMQFEEYHDWVPALGVSYHLGVDGISLLMVMLTTFLTPIVILGSWNSIFRNVKGYMISMLVLESGILGVFVSLDLFMFYVFWEVMLIPMYFIIGIWGGEQRIYAAVKFFIYTMVGSLLMMVAILFVYFYHANTTGVYTFDILRLQQITYPLGYQTWLFLAFGLSFAIKVPMFPFHTWLPDAHVEAPTGGSVILAGVLLKMGTYGFLRFCLPMFPNAATEFTPWIFALGVIGIIYGALVAMVQPDIKKLVAYSSVSHLGFVMLGIFALNYQGLQGGLIQMVNHGLSTGALFLIVGMIYDRRHTRLIKDFGGLAKQLPVFTTFFMIVTLSSIGLPGLNGFVGEFLILVGTFLKSKLTGVLAATGVILAAVYMLTMFQRVMFGKLENEANRKLVDLSGREIAVLVPIVVVIIFIGVYPNAFLRKMEPSINHLITMVESKQVQALKGDEPTAENLQSAASR
ncbi:NADH-quinone oxidoreductase subunit M [bacterium]|nr:NADH-quinone oxidoreductase subunit M [bacterium]